MTPVELLAAVIMTMVIGTSLVSEDEEVWYCFVCAGMKSETHYHEEDEDENTDTDSDTDGEHKPTGPRGSMR